MLPCCDTTFDVMKFQDLKSALPWIGLILLLMIILYLIWHYYDQRIEDLGVLQNQI